MGWGGRPGLETTTRFEMPSSHLGASAPSSDSAKSQFTHVTPKSSSRCTGRRRQWTRCESSEPNSTMSRTDGRFRFRKHLVRVGQGLTGYDVAVEEVSDVVVKVRLHEIDLGEFRLGA